MNLSNFTKSRPEISLLKEAGYAFSNPAEVVELFEEKVAQYCGSPYAVATDCATHAIELCLRYTGPWETLQVPEHTYLSIPQVLRKLAIKVQWTTEKWHGVYTLHPSPILDASLRFKENMYSSDLFYCLSFQFKKHIPIGRGGMILTDNKQAYTWLKKAVHDGRNPGTLWKKDDITQLGYHYYMTPENAARGILLMDLKDYSQEDSGGWQNYPRLTDQPFFAGINEWT